MQLPASATFTEACQLLEQLGGVDGDSVDASALQALDTSAIALLLEARRRVQARGGTFRVTGAPPKLRALAAIYGVDGLLSFDDSR